MNMEGYKDDIRRSFRVLGLDRGFWQNAEDITAWYHLGYISKEQFHELKKFNRVEYNRLDESEGV